MSDPLESYELVFLLGLSFQELTSAFVAELDAAGYDDLRPVHGYALQVVAHAQEITASELGEQLGITKQAAGQLVDRLVELGYLERAVHPQGGRRRRLVLAARGRRHLHDAGAILHRVEATMLSALPGEQRVALRSALVTLVRSRVPGPAVPPLRPLW
jgi:DNA-binding MarR family transcriptional regulator